MLRSSRSRSVRLRCSQSSDGKNFKEVYQDGPGFAPNEYVIFVDSENKGACASGSTLAFAGPCEMHPTTDRPIMGSINFCPQKMEVDEPGKTMLVGTAIHELAHALGFVKTSYALMRDENGNPRTPRDPKTGKPPRNDRGQFVPSESTVKLINRPWISAVGSFSKQFLAFVTPQLLAEGRKHYNCPNLDGIDIENEGGEGTVGTHFEKRVVGDEIMAGVTGVKTVASRLTLAFFKDSGGKSIEPYCEEKSDVMCYHKAAFGICAVAQFTTSLPAPDQYFKGIPNQGGSSTLVDKCPMVQVSVPNV
uniref:Leishmanolysin-like peptidase n=1 Tax=Trichobilharzia regenti TaxID=157069 RepID=A0AA85KPM0_TRIRE|nr:unnamed protein product [Trichobilharzia regenti]